MVIHPWSSTIRCTEGASHGSNSRGVSVRSLNGKPQTEFPNMVYIWIIFGQYVIMLIHYYTVYIYINWLVVWNILYFSIYWEWSSQLTFIFFRGGETTNQGRTIQQPSEGMDSFAKTTWCLGWKMGYRHSVTAGRRTDCWTAGLRELCSWWYNVIHLFGHFEDWILVACC